MTQTLEDKSVEELITSMLESIIKTSKGKDISLDYSLIEGLLPDPLYEQIWRKVAALKRCRQSGKAEWGQQHEKDINDIIDNLFPHGSGLDGCAWIEYDECDKYHLAFTSEYHPMDEYGGYRKWSDVKIICEADPEVGGIQVDVVLEPEPGSFLDDEFQKESIEDYLSERYDYALKQRVDVKEMLGGKK